MTNTNPINVGAMDDSDVRDPRDPEVSDIRWDYQTKLAAFRDQSHRMLSSLGNLSRELARDLDVMKGRLPDAGPDQKVYLINEIRRVENEIRTIRDATNQLCADVCSITVIT